jgi:Xaa-Pro aminopeptidase
MPIVPRQEIQRRLESLQARLAAADPPLDAAIVVQGVDLYYFAGTLQTSHLLVPRSGEPRLLVRKVLERARQDSPLADIRPFTSLKGLPQELAALCGPPPWRIGMELDVLPANALDVYRRLLGGACEIRDVSEALLGIRAVKSAWEIDEIRRSARINERIYGALGELVERGLSTHELQGRLNAVAHAAGHIGLVRMRGFNLETLLGIVVSGPTGAMPGHSQFPIGGLGPHPALAAGGDAAPIRDGVPIIVDYLANANGYHHDQSRMAVLGGMPPQAERIYESMRGILRRIERVLAPGAIPSRIYQEALDEAAAAGLADGFLGPPGLAVPFVGHATGLEVNETPVLARGFDAPLVEGHVLAVEPKFTHPEFGVIGVENTYAVRRQGAENLSQTPEDVVVV